VPIFFLWWLGYRSTVTDVVGVTSPTDAVVLAAAVTSGVTIPEIRRFITEEHDDTSWMSWVLVGEHAPVVVWDFMLLCDDIW